MADTLIDLLSELQELTAKLEQIGFGGDSESVTHNGVTRATVAKQIKDRFAPVFSVASGYVPYATLADLNASGAPIEDHIAFVWFDPTKSNNGVYGWDGASWEKSIYDNESAFLNYASRTDQKLTSVDGQLKGINSDIFSGLVWVKGFWQTGDAAAIPNGSDIGYNAGQYSWYSRLDVTDYQSVTVSGAYNGSAASTATKVHPGIAVYGDSVLVDVVVNASGSNTIYLSDYAEYDQVELIIQCRNTADIDGFEGVCVVHAYQERFIRDADLISERNRLDYLELISNGIDSDIFSGLVWIRGFWQTGDDAVVPNGSDIGYNAGQYSWYSRLDVTDYQSVTITGAYNGSSASTATRRYPGVSVYGDGILINEITDASGVNTIYMSDYSGYDRVELIVQCRNTANLAGFEGSCIVQVFRSPAPVNQQNPKRLVMVGDSLLGHDSAAVIKFMNRILAANGYDSVIKRAQGGENIIGNLTRAGGLGVRVLSDFTLPSVVGGSVNIELGSSWVKSDGTYANIPYTGFPRDQYVVFNGIKGSLTIQSSDIVAMAFYDSSQTLISTETETGNYTAPANAAYFRYSIANPSAGVPHVTIAGVAIDIDATATTTGYINTSGAVVSDADYLCSGFIALTAGDSVYFDSLAVGAGYTFERVSEVASGENLNVSAGHVAFDTAVEDDSDYPHVWFTGQNGGYEDDQDWALMVESAARNLGDNFIVCSTALIRTTPALIREATARFGRKYVDLQSYTRGQAVYDLQSIGVLDEAASPDDYETLFWGADPIHQNDRLSVAFAARMWNQLLNLGYVEGVAVGPDDSVVDWTAVFSDVS